LRGHGTHVVDGKLMATLCGVVERVNKLVFVRPLKTRYDAAQGDVVVARVTEVAGKKWVVDVGGRVAAGLLLSAVNLAGGVQRRRNAEDELAMRGVLKEGDLLSAEVQSVGSDGAAALHTRSAKYGKLAGGQLVCVPPALVKRQKQHFHTLDAIGVDLILGCNGMLWVAPAASRTTSADRHTGMEVDGEEDVSIPAPPKEQMEAVVRVGCALRALSRCYLPIYPATIMDTFELSLEKGVPPADMLGSAFLGEVVRSEAVRRHTAQGQAGAQ